MADNEAGEVSARSSQVDLCLVKKDKVGALLAALSNPPVNSKEESIKVSRLQEYTKSSIFAQFLCVFL